MKEGSAKNEKNKDNGGKSPTRIAVGKKAAATRKVRERQQVILMIKLVYIYSAIYKNDFYTRNLEKMEVRPKTSLHLMKVKTSPAR